MVVEPLEPTTPEEGSTLTLVCRVKDTKLQNISRYVWKRNLKTLTVDGATDRLVLTSLNASRDDGSYTCHVTYEAGYCLPMAAPYILKVQCESKAQVVYFWLSCVTSNYTFLVHKLICKI